ncbi:MAG: alanine racemase [Balneolales bacterium]|nr:alanine racemase [Balneolales bacterium]
MVVSSTTITKKSESTSFVEINLDTLDANLKRIKEVTGPGVKTMAVVKANAYGHDSVLIARALSGKITALGVATVEEAVTIRKAGVIMPLLVFAPVRKSALSDYKAFNIVAVAGSFEELQLMSPAVSFHLEFDTGMGRLGFEPADWPEIKKVLEKKKLRPSGIMTHFATADEPSTAKTADQLSRFNSLLDEMGSWSQSKVIHASNSGGMMHYPEARFSMVRFGISLYGYAPGKQFPDALKDLKPVLSWKSTVVACKRLRKGETISYDATYTADKDGWLVVIPVGYADGLRRGLSNRIYMKTGGEMLKQVGNITMDYTMLWSEKPVPTGQQVTILGPDAMTADQWAEMLGTITYEIICGIHPKIDRHTVTGRA